MLYSIPEAGYSMMGFNARPSLLIARNEFKKITGHPLIFMFIGILVLIAALNGIGFKGGLSWFEQVMEGDVFVKVGMSQIYWNSSMYCTFAAMFIGLISVAGDRANGSMGVLLSKPLYKRDVIAGKFMGIAAFILVLVSIAFLASSLLIMLFFRAPLSLVDFFIRLFTIIILLFLECSLAAGIAMMIGILFRNLLDAAIIVASVLYVEWYTQISVYLGGFSFISPSSLYSKIFNAAPGQHFTGLMDTSMGFMDWLGVAAPYIVLMVLYVIAVFLVNSYVFVRSEG